MSLLKPRNTATNVAQASILRSPCLSSPAAPLTPMSPRRLSRERNSTSAWIYFWSAKTNVCLFYKYLYYPTAVALTTNHSTFIVWPRVKLLGLKRGFLHTPQSGSPPRPQKWPELGKNTPSHNHPKIARSALSRDPTAVTSATNHSFFAKWP